MDKKLTKTASVLFVASGGGHIAYLGHLRHWWQDLSKRTWVTDTSRTPDYLAREQVYGAHFPDQRHLFHLMLNMGTALRILGKEKPDIVVSTGSGVAIPFLISAKLRGITTVFIETYTLTPKRTLTGRFAYLLVDKFIVTQRPLLRWYPKAIVMEGTWSL